MSDEEDEHSEMISQEWADWWEEASVNLPEECSVEEVCTVFSLLMETYQINSWQVSNHIQRVLYYHMQQEILSENYQNSTIH